MIPWVRTLSNKCLKNLASQYIRMQRKAKIKNHYTGSDHGRSTVSYQCNDAKTKTISSNTCTCYVDLLYRCSSSWVLSVVLNPRWVTCGPGSRILAHRISAASGIGICLCSGTIWAGRDKSSVSSLWARIPDPSPQNFPSENTSICLWNRHEMSGRDISNVLPSPAWKWARGPCVACQRS